MWSIRVSMAPVHRPHVRSRNVRAVTPHRPMTDAATAQYIGAKPSLTSERHTFPSDTVTLSLSAKGRDMTSQARTSVIVAGARTPMGRLLGSLQQLLRRRPRRLRHQGGAGAGRASTGDQVQYVIMGQVLQAGAGQIPARQAAVKAGIPMNVPALTINKVCLSGLDAIALADQLIRAGEFDIVVAGGQESMTNAPHLLPKSREGYKYGAIEMLDSMAHDGLTDAFENIAMGESTEKHNTRLGIGARRAGRVRPRCRTSGPPPPRRTACSTPRSPRWRSRSARATRWSSARTRASAPRPPRRRWRSCARPSPRTARSPPAPPRRSPTAPPRSS